MGADPIAITDNLNFGNPERPEIMGQIVRAIEGMAEACRALDFPVVSGNVSLYNETNGAAIPPTPAVGAVGLIADPRARRLLAPGGGQPPGPDRRDRAAGPRCTCATPRENERPAAGGPGVESKTGDLIRGLIESGAVRAVHDLSDGGLPAPPPRWPWPGSRRPPQPLRRHLHAHAACYGEDQARYVLEVAPELAEEVIERSRLLALPARVVARVGGDALTLKDETPLPLGDLRAAHEGWMPGYMGGV